ACLKWHKNQGLKEKNNKWDSNTDVVPVEPKDTGFNIGEAGNTGLAGIFMAAFLTAWGTNSIVNKIIAPGKTTSENVRPGPLTKPQLPAKTEEPTPAPATPAPKS